MANVKSKFTQDVSMALTFGTRNQAERAMSAIVSSIGARGLEVGEGRKEGKAIYYVGYGIRGFQPPYYLAK